MPYAGTASIDISRVDDDIDIFWDSSLLVSDVNGSPLGEVDIRFGYVVVPGISGFFGTEAVDLIRVADAPIPIPSTLLLLASSLIAVLGFRRKFRKK